MLTLLPVSEPEMLPCVLGTSHREMNFQYTAVIQAFVGRPHKAPGSSAPREQDRLPSNLSGVTVEHVFNRESLFLAAWVSLCFVVFVLSLGGERGFMVESLLCCLHW